MLTLTDIKSVLKYSFEWSITDGSIVQCGKVNNPDYYDNLQGKIFFNEQKQLELVLKKKVSYPEYESIIGKMNEKREQLKSGVIYKHNEYYELFFIDARGRRWVTSKFLLYNYLEIGCKEIIIRLNLNNIGLVNNRNKSNILYSYTLEEIKITPNRFVKNLDKWGINKFEIDTKDFSINLIKHGVVSILHFKSKSNDFISPELYRLINEALDIVCFHPIHYPIQDIYDRKYNNVITRIYSYKKRNPNSAKIFLTSHMPDGNDDIKEFILKYVSYFQNTPVMLSNLVYMWWYRTYGYTLDLENKLLILSVAIESIALKYISKESNKSNIYDYSEIKRLGRIIKDSGVSESLTRRVNKYIGSLNSSSKPIFTILTESIEKGILIKGMNVEWQTVRNESAHGIERNLSIENEEQLQEVFQKVNYLEEMFFRLFFHIIGYEGHFCQFSVTGYPFTYLNIRKKGHPKKSSLNITNNY